jgi:dephospho-CoA kinase
MITLGLTGGIGSGKSAVAAHLASEPGVRVLYADDEAKRLMHEDIALRAALVERFGREIYDTEGRLDRAALADRVFTDPEELAALNALVHPAVREALLTHMEDARKDGVELLVYEAALLYEVGAAEHLDGVAVVDAPVETRIARVMARDGVKREQVLARMHSQLPPEDLRARADFVIVNNQDLAHLHTRTDQLYDALLFAD